LCGAGRPLSLGACLQLIGRRCSMTLHRARPDYYARWHNHDRLVQIRQYRIGSTTNIAKEACETHSLSQGSISTMSTTRRSALIILLFVSCRCDRSRWDQEPSSKLHPIVKTSRFSFLVGHSNNWGMCSNGRVGPLPVFTSFADSSCPC
jgi:hypothetical protein